MLQLAKNIRKYIIAALLLTVCPQWVLAQINWQNENLLKDTLSISKNQHINNLFKEAIGSIKKGPVDTVANNLLFTGKSEEPFKPYEGKVIRHIYFKALRFENSISDTSSRFISMAARLADRMHINTKQKVIANNLFIKENTPLNAYRVADNERYLRSLDYIQDARILITGISNDGDSVDLLVISKDLFNVSADGASNGLSHLTGSVIDANFLGTAQRLEASTLYDPSRQPNSGWGAFYKKNNLGNTFISMSVGLSNINKNQLSHEEENTAFLNFSRPLISPYSRFAGGLLLSKNVADNRYNLIPAQYFGYNYTNTDFWIAYNLGVKHFPDAKDAVRNRSFVSLRYFNYSFQQTPLQVGTNFDPIYNNRQAVLGQITFFKQEYFKTQYIYGFGTTEDLPYGYNISFIGGWHKQLDLQRPYGGVSIQRYLSTTKGDFLQFYFKTGTFLNNGSVQDATLVCGINAFGRLLFLNDIIIRPVINMSYAALDKPLTNAPLRLDNTYGLGGWLSDSAVGYKRLSLQTESVFFLHGKVFGFRFAPFAHVDLNALIPADNKLYHSTLYSGWGGGIRTRNENLVFETIELRFYYYPITAPGMDHFKLVLISNLRFRYNSNLINRPALIEGNSSP